MATTRSGCSSSKTARKVTAKVAIEQVDLVRQRRGHIEPLGRPGEVQLLGHRDAVPQTHIHNQRLSQEVLDPSTRIGGSSTCEDDIPYAVRLDVTAAGAV